MTRDSASAQKVVLMSVIALVLISAYRGRLTSDSGGKGFFDRLWGVGWLAIMLGVAADVAPTVAGPFAILVVLGSVTNGGDAALHNLLGKIGGGGSGAASGGGKPSKPKPKSGNSHPSGPLGPTIGGVIPHP